MPFFGGLGMRMLRFVYGNELGQFEKLARSMFRDRADQFKVRLGWDVSVDCHGEERDQYDALNPLYVIWENAGGYHGGSMRFLPTTGPVMVNDVFGHLTGAEPICSERIWECTRFCLSRTAGPNVAAALMLGGGEIMTGFGISHFAGVFDRRMERIYRAIGSEPEILGAQGQGNDKISLGLWSFTPDSRIRVARKAEISPQLSSHWFKRAFGANEAPVLAMSA